MMCFLSNPMMHPGRCDNCRIKWIVVTEDYTDRHKYFCFDTEAEAHMVTDAIRERKCWAGVRYCNATIIGPDDTFYYQTCPTILTREECNSNG